MTEPAGSDVASDDPRSEPAGSDMASDDPMSEPAGSDMASDDPRSEPAGSDMASSDPMIEPAGSNAEDPMAAEIQAAQEAMIEAGITLQQAGEAVENAQTEEDLARAEELLSRARIVVIVAGQDLMEAREVYGDGNEEIFEAAEGALDEATVAIVVASDELMGSPKFEDLATASGSPRQDRKAGTLEDELEQSLIVFDGQIQEARANVEQPGAPAKGTSTGGTEVRLPPGDRPEPDKNPDVASKPTGSNSTGSVPMEGKQEETPEQVALNVPEDVGSGQNDDIVAQQLREAAMAETDPELRDKLWEEYKRYKAGL